MKITVQKIASLKRAEYNPRKLTDKKYHDLKKSLEDFGLVDPIVVNMHPDRKGVIIGGHQRCKIWEDLGNTEIQCVEVELDVVKEKELNIRLNKNTGEFDYDLLNEFFDKSDLMDWGFLGSEFPQMPPEIDEVEYVEPVYPIVPTLSEKYDYVIVFATNEIDNAFLHNFFQLEPELSYKNTAVGVGRVVSFEKFAKIVQRGEGDS